jgi:hypothetical protein
MKNTLPYLFLIPLFFLFSCEGPEGPEGPQGAAGAQGAQGVAGVAGPPGTANVMQITYTTKVHSGVSDLLLGFPASAALTTAIIEKSLFYVYVKQSGVNSAGQSNAYWFPIPGETVTGNEYSYYVFSGTSTTNPGLFLRRLVNYRSGAETFDSIRLLIIPAEKLTNARLNSEINMADYEEVRKHFNLPE